MKYLIIFILLFSFSCVEQQKGKKYSEELIVNLPVGKKLINATWKMDNLWLLVENRKKKDIPKEYILKIYSFNIFKGQIIVKEN